jgi:hypothetical protein
LDFILDADERPTPELAGEMRLVVTTAPSSVDGFRMRRRDYLNGTWLRHAQISPYYVRLVRRGEARYTGEINEVLEVEGEIADLKSPLEHFPFSKGIAHWVSKHNTYSTMEAQLVASGITHSDASWKTAISLRISTHGALLRKLSSIVCPRVH